MQLSTLKYNILSRINKKISGGVKDKKTISYFTFSLSLFSLSFFGLFAIRPTLITAVSLIKEVNDLRSLNLSYENKISDIIKAQSEYEKVRDRINLIDLAIPTNANFPNLARALESFAAKDNIAISQLQIDKAPISTVKNDKMESINFLLIASGDYPSVKSYLNHIVNWRRIITVNSLEFSPEGGTQSGKLKITMKGNTYYEP